MRKNGIDPDAVECAEDPPYDIPSLRVSWVRHETPDVVTAWWRGVGPAHNVFVVESFIDELAAAAKRDPVAFRRSLLAKTPRARGVLELAAEKSGWGSPLPAGVGRGVMVQFAFGSFLSVVCEVQVTGGMRSACVVPLPRWIAARPSIPTLFVPSSRAVSSSG